MPKLTFDELKKNYESLELSDIYLLNINRTENLNRILDFSKLSKEELDESEEKFDKIFKPVFDYYKENNIDTDFDIFDKIKVLDKNDNTLFLLQNYKGNIFDENNKDVLKHQKAEVLHLLANKPENKIMIQVDDVVNPGKQKSIAVVNKGMTDEIKLVVEEQAKKEEEKKKQSYNNISNKFIEINQRDKSNIFNLDLIFNNDAFIKKSLILKDGIDGIFSEEEEQQKRNLNISGGKLYEELLVSSHVSGIPYLLRTEMSDLENAAHAFDEIFSSIINEPAFSLNNFVALGESDLLDKTLRSMAMDSLSCHAHGDNKIEDKLSADDMSKKAEMITKALILKCMQDPKSDLSYKNGLETIKITSPDITEKYRNKVEDIRNGINKKRIQEDKDKQLLNEIKIKSNTLLEGFVININVRGGIVDSIDHVFKKVLKENAETLSVKGKDLDLWNEGLRFAFSHFFEAKSYMVGNDDRKACSFSQYLKKLRKDNKTDDIKALIKGYEITKGFVEFLNSKVPGESNKTNYQFIIDNLIGAKKYKEVDDSVKNFRNYVEKIANAFSDNKVDVTYRAKEIDYTHSTLSIKKTDSFTTVGVKKGKKKTEEKKEKKTEILYGYEKEKFKKMRNDVKCLKSLIEWANIKTKFFGDYSIVSAGIKELNKHLDKDGYHMLDEPDFYADEIYKLKSYMDTIYKDTGKYLERKAKENQRKFERNQVGVKNIQNIDDEQVFHDEYSSKTEMKRILAILLVRKKVEEMLQAILVISDSDFMENVSKGKQQTEKYENIFSNSEKIGRAYNKQLGKIEDNKSFYRDIDYNDSKFMIENQNVDNKDMDQVKISIPKKETKPVKMRVL